MKTTKLPTVSCPTCGVIVTAATHPTEDISPAPGDGTICIVCQDILIFTDELGLRKITEADISRLPLEIVSQYQAALVKVRAS